ncbi:acetyl-CoA carboxylase biotin carboxyl carrier protein [Falsiroseomonas sp. HW251]|uniref:acetyl-CoA carboxylase biotin carboxyl carrier protein n=1 Tax=Falsiroseomonas sp. HW251 TaxID=3390998 RepID=UPI003D31E674
MELDRIKAFIDAMAASDLAEMTFSEGGWTLRLTRGAVHRDEAAPVPSASAPRRPAAPDREPRLASRPKLAAATEAEIRSPMPGIVYLRPAPDKPDFVSAGARIAPGAVICMVEAMKTFLEVRADRGGLVDAILVASGDEVELGQPLMRIG